MSPGKTCTAIQATRIVEESPYGYDFGDGWRANITAEIVTGKEASKIRRKSIGFCGYDWMVSSIMSKGRIECPSKGE